MEISNVEFYFKGDQTRLVYSQADRVAAEFDGFRPAVSEDSDYRVLQTQAKDRGIPANQSREALLEALAVDGDEAEQE